MSISDCKAFLSLFGHFNQQSSTYYIMYILKESLVKTFTVCARQQHRKNWFFVFLIINPLRTFSMDHSYISRCWLISRYALMIVIECTFRLKISNRDDDDDVDNPIWLYLCDIWWETRLRSAVFQFIGILSDSETPTDCEWVCVCLCHQTI